MLNLKFWYHTIIVGFYLLVGNILIYLEPGMAGSKECARRAKKRHDIQREIFLKMKQSFNK